MVSGLKSRILTKKFFRKKTNYLIAILIGLCFAFSIMIQSLTYSTRLYYEDNVFNFVTYKQFAILAQGNKSKLENILSEIPEIAGYFDSYGYTSYWYLPEFEEYSKNGVLPSISLNGVASEIEVVIGNNLSNSNDLEMVCPNEYYTDYSNETEIDLSPYIGKNLKVQYINEKNPVEFSIKLVGLYDNQKMNKFYDSCFINYQPLEKMNHEADTFNSDVVFYELKNIVDEEKVTNQLREQGFWPDSVMDVDTDLAIDSLDMLVYLGYGLFVISMFIIACVISFNNSKNKSSIMLSKTYGYNNKKLLFSYLLEMLYLFLMSVLFSGILVFIIQLVFKKIIPMFYKTFEYITIYVSPFAILEAIIVILVLCILIGLINFAFSAKVNIYKSLNAERR